MNRAQRLRAAEAWLRDQNPRSAPIWADVQVVAAMDVHDPAVAELLLLQDRSRLLARWHELRAALGGRGTAVPAGQPHEPRPPDPAAAADQPPSRPQAPPPSADEPGTEPPGTTDERLGALTRWRDDTAEQQPAVRGLSDIDLLRIARSAARSVEEIRDLPLRARQVAVDHASSISAVLRGRRAGTTAEPEQQPIPGAPQPPQPVNGAGSAEAAAPEWLADAHFAAFSWAVPAETEAAVPLSAAALEPTGATISWPPSTAETDGWFAYRVVSSDEYPPTSAPDHFDQVGATRARAGIDPRPTRSAVRHYSVWVNHGPDEATARASQPRLHAVGQLISGIRALQVRVEGERVYGRWDALPGTTRVAVMRLPEAEAPLRPGYHASYTYPDTLQVNATGFTDTPGEGGSFVYRVFAVADVAGADVWSAAVSGHASVAENVEAVTDLSVERTAAGTLEVSWTPPGAGRVEVYRLPDPPADSLPGTMSSREALTRPLPTAHLLIQPSDVSAGRATMHDVRLPAGWTRAYFVPVTVLDERHLRVGTPEVLILPQPPTQLRCVERVRAQIVTFAWPEGVELVRVLSGPRGTAAGSVGAAPLAELTRQQYDEQGGIHLPNPLPADGCSLHAYGVTYHVGKPILSVPISIEYPGLHRIRYQLLRRPAQATEAPSRGGGLFGRSAAQPQATGPDTLVVQLKASHRLDRIRLLLVHQVHRLPLHSHDGTPVFDQEVTLTPQDAPILDHGIVAQPGYLRLFVAGADPDRPPIAVLDPPVSTLRQP